MTYGERRKRVNTKLIERDFTELESSFLAYAQRVNKKRHSQLIKRAEKLIPELLTAYQKGDTEEVEGILQSLSMPSSKEWRKGIKKLVLGATRAGILRAYLEMQDLRKYYEFAEDWFDVIDEGYGYDVVIPEGAMEFIEQYAYDLGVITEDTVLERLREVLQQGLEEGVSPEEMTQLILDVTETWVSPWHAQTIARTETGKYYNAGRLASWSDPATNGFVEALQYDAIVDTRTTHFCRHADGKIIAMSNKRMIAEFTPPNHFQCRATWLPVTRYDEWKEDFPQDLTPEKGFTYESPLGWLERDKKEPYVQPRKEPLKMVASAIESIADAHQWGEQNGIEVSLDSLPIETNKEVLERLERILEKYPMLKEFFGNIKDKPQIGRFGGEYAHAWRDGVSLNPKVYGDPDYVKSSYENDVKQDFHPVGTDHLSIITHELGHTLENMLIKKGVRTRTGKTWLSRQVQTDVLKELGLKKADLPSELSVYGQTEPAEFWAEAFAEYVDSDNPRRVARAVGRKIEELLKQLEEED